MKSIQLYKAYDWRRLTGRTVEVRRGGILARTGWVSTVMPDGSGLWIEADQNDPRQYISKAEGYVLWSDDFYSSGDMPN